MFKFQLGQRAVIQVSGEEGEVVGRAEYNNAEPSYFVRYKTAQGLAATEWWTEQALV